MTVVNDLPFIDAYRETSSSSGTVARRPRGINEPGLAVLSIDHPPVRLRAGPSGAGITVTLRRVHLRQVRFAAGWVGAYCRDIAA